MIKGVEKMKAVGVIVEYNPFHNGHLYHLQEARKQAKADVVIAIMSGNFLQRGEPAIIDKWSRTELALEGGADLVVELPVAFSVQPADYFARGGIGLLKQLRCEAICFGTETGTAKEYEEFAKQWLKNEDKLDNAFKRYKNDGSSYAAQMERISIEAGLNLPLHNSYPNMILGKAYAKENYRFYPPMELIPIKRKGSCYHEKDLNTNEFSSATSIRNILLKTNNVKNAESALPAFAVKKLKKAVLVDWEQFWPLLRYQIIVQPPDKLREIYQMTEGIEYRLKEKAKEASSFDNFISSVKTKRFSWVRIQRLCVYILLQTTKKTIKENIEKPSAIHLLGFNDNGKKYLKEKKELIDLPIISQINKKNKKLWQEDILAGQVYQLGDSRLEKQDYGHPPIRK